MPGVLGIDFGTTNTSAALALRGADAIALRFPPPERADAMRTAVLFLPDGTRVAGQAAIEQADVGTTNSNSGPRLLVSFKTLLSEPERGRTRWMTRFDPSKLVPDTRTEGMIRVEGGPRYVLTTDSRIPAACPAGFTLGDVALATAEVMARVRAVLTAQSGRTALDHVVLGVPVGFSDIGKSRLMEAVGRAGLADPSTVNLLHEPMAVALTYGIEHRAAKRVLVFDHGGGTLDMTVVDIHRAGGRPRDLHYTVVAQAGYERAGGYYDRCLLAAILDGLGSRRSDVLHYLGVADPMEITHPLVLESVRAVKERLCSGLADHRARPIRFLYPFGSTQVSEAVRPELLRDAISEELQSICQRLQALLATCDKMAPTPGRPLGGVEQVLLAGGSSLNPYVQQVVRDMFAPGRIPIDASYAGTRTCTQGLARAVQFQALIEELSDAPLGIYDPKKSGVRQVVAFGTPIRHTTAESVYGSSSGAYVEPAEGQVTLPLFEERWERWQPVGVVEVRDTEAAQTLQIVAEIDPSTRRPRIRAFSCRTGNELVVTGPEDAGTPVLELGQIVRFQHNKNRSNAPSGVGCIVGISVVRTGQACRLAVGDMSSYRLTLKDAEARSVNVTAENKDLEIYEIEIPRPGEVITLDRTDPSKFRPLPQLGSTNYALVPMPANVAARPGSVSATDEVVRRSQREVAAASDSTERATGPGILRRLFGSRPERHKPSGSDGENQV